MTLLGLVENMSSELTPSLPLQSKSIRCKLILPIVEGKHFDADLCAFIIDESYASPCQFVYYNNPSSRDGSVSFLECFTIDERYIVESLSIDLNKTSPSRMKIILMPVEHQGEFQVKQGLSGAKVIFLEGGSEAPALEIDLGDCAFTCPESETVTGCLEVADIHREGDKWIVSSVKAQHDQVSDLIKTVMPD